MATRTVKNTFRRVSSDDDILLAEQQTKDTTAAVLVEVLQDRSKMLSAHRHQATVPCDARPRSLDLEVGGDVASVGVPRSGSAAGRRREEKTAADVQAEVTVFRCQEDVTEFAKVIARRLQRMGDTYQNTISEATLRDLTTIIASPQPSPDADSAHLRTLLNTLTANLSLSRVFQIFVLLHQLIRELVTVFGNKPSVAHDRRWDLFQELMDQTITRVTRWICSNGGWAALVATIRSRGNSFAESPPSSPATLTKTKSRVFSLSEDGEFTPTSWETRSACELCSSSPSHGNPTTSPAHDSQEGWCEIFVEAAVTTGTSRVGQASAAIPVPTTASGDSHFDRFRSGSLPASRRERRGISRTSQIALTAYSTVACYLGD